MMKVAITGQEGFLGKSLAKELKRRKYLVSTFDRQKNDLEDYKSLKSFLSGVDVVIHLAAKNRDSNFNIFKVNTLGTLNLLEGIKEFSPSARIIFASSFQVYGKVNIYSQSKKSAEELINFFTECSNLKATILRIANIYGPGCKPFYNSVIATFSYLIKNNKEVVINGDGKQLRDYIYVDDVVKAIISSVEYKQQKKIEYFDICTGRLVSLKRIIKIFESAIKRPVKVIYNKEHQNRETITKKTYSKARTKLRWKPKIKLEEGIKSTINE